MLYGDSCFWDGTAPREQSEPWTLSVDTSRGIVVLPNVVTLYVHIHCIPQDVLLVSVDPSFGEDPPTLVTAGGQSLTQASKAATEDGKQTPEVQTAERDVDRSLADGVQGEPSNPAHAVASTPEGYKDAIEDFEGDSDTPRSGYVDDDSGPLALALEGPTAPSPVDAKKHNVEGRGDACVNPSAEMLDDVKEGLATLVHEDVENDLDTDDDSGPIGIEMEEATAPTSAEAKQQISGQGDTSVSQPAEADVRECPTLAHDEVQGLRATEMELSDSSDDDLEILRGRDDCGGLVGSRRALEYERVNSPLQLNVSAESSSGEEAHEIIESLQKTRKLNIDSLYCSMPARKLQKSNNSEAKMAPATGVRAKVCPPTAVFRHSTPVIPHTANTVHGGNEEGQRKEGQDSLEMFFNEVHMVSSMRWR